MHPHERITDPNYFRGVLGNLVANNGHAVRYGLTGEGFFANYQIEREDRVLRFDGRTHKPFHDRPFESFEAENLSEPYSRNDVQEMIAARLTR